MEKVKTETRGEHTDMIEKVEYVPPLNCYISASRDGTIRQWEVRAACVAFLFNQLVLCGSVELLYCA